MSDPGPTDRAESASSAELLRTIPTASAAWLAAAMSNPNLSAEHVSLIARSRSATEPLLQRIASDPRWAGDYKVKVSLVRNAHTPRPLGMSLVKHLFWRDLAIVSDDFLLAPPLRHLAERALLDRLPELAVGERISLARIAGRGLHPALILDSESRVLEAFLWNSRLTEQALAGAINNPATPRLTLAVIAAHPRWRARYALRAALAKNRQTPLAITLGLLTSLTEPDLRGLAESAGTPLILKLACLRVLGDPDWRKRRNEDRDDPGSP